MKRSKLIFLLVLIGMLSGLIIVFTVDFVEAVQALKVLFKSRQSVPTSIM
jgi:hypothetical protein